MSHTKTPPPWDEVLRWVSTDIIPLPRGCGRVAIDPTLKAGIESDLRRYKRWKARIKEIDDLLADVSIGSGTSDQPVGHSGKINDPTFEMTINRSRLAQERAYLLRRVSRVENALSAMNDEQRQLVRLWYFEEKDRKYIEAEMGIVKNTFYRIKESALEIYAEVAGLIPLVR